MSPCTFVTEVDGARTVIRMLGGFDRSSALSLHERVAAESGPEVVLDFSLVGEFEDLGVATLAGLLSALAGRRRISLRGLRQHQLRLFRYFGIDAIAAEPARGGPAALRPPPR